MLLQPVGSGRCHGSALEFLQAVGMDKKKKEEEEILLLFYLVFISPRALSAYWTRVGMLSEETSFSGIILFPQFSASLLEWSTP